MSQTFKIRGQQFTSDLTDDQAAEVASRVPSEERDRSMARVLLSSLRDHGTLSDKERPVLHRIALRQLEREAVEDEMEAVPTCPMPALLKFLEPASKSVRSGACLTFKALLEIDGSAGTVEVRSSRPYGRFPGSYYVTDGGPYGKNKTYGRLDPDGTLSLAPDCPAGVMATLDELEADPLSFVMKYGVRTGRCCFCDAYLSDDEPSAKLGYGPVCARHYHLPHGKEGLAKLQELVGA